MSAPAHEVRNAGIVSRALAAALDVAVVLTLLGGAYLGVVFVMFVVSVRDFALPSVNWVFTTGGFLIAAMAYQTLAWSLSGRTVGQAVMGLRVERRSGRRLHLAQALARAALCTLVPIGLGWVLISPTRRSLQDIAVRTCVVDADERRGPSTSR